MANHYHIFVLDFKKPRNSSVSLKRYLSPEQARIEAEVAVAGNPNLKAQIHPCDLQPCTPKRFDSHNSQYSKAINAQLKKQRRIKEIAKLRAAKTAAD